MGVQVQSGRVLSSVTRSITYELTVRDNDARGGQTASDNKRLIVQSAAGPFVVTSQNTSGITWLPNTTETVTWNVANTTAAPVNSNLVNILLSTDGGENFDVVLASNTPNDGSESITVPTGIVSIDCRLMVESADNVFFNVNTENFAVNAIERVVCNTYSSGVLNIPIPDSTVNGSSGGAVGNVITVPTTTDVDDVNVTVNVSHTYIGDLIIQLQNPQADFTNVWSTNCANGAVVDLNIVFDDDAANAIDCTATSTTPPSTYIPDSPLSTLAGNPGNGDWTLLMADFFVGDTGTFDSWELEICSREVVPLSNPEVAVNNFKIYPNPSNGLITVESSLFKNEQTQLSVYDVSGKLISQQELSGNLKQTIDLRDQLSSGLYLIKIEGTTINSTHKLVIE